MVNATVLTCEKKCFFQKLFIQKKLYPEKAQLQIFLAMFWCKPELTEDFALTSTSKQNPSLF